MRKEPYGGMLTATGLKQLSIKLSLFTLKIEQIIHFLSLTMKYILGDWWKSDVQEVLDEFLRIGGDPNVSDALTINGQPGDLYACSKSDTFKLIVDYGKTYMLRMINAGMNNIFYFGIPNHTLTVVGTDAAYSKPLKSDYITISPGQTLDILLEANQPLDRYYMAARVFVGAGTADFDNTTTTVTIANRNTFVIGFYYY